MDRTEMDDHHSTMTSDADSDSETEYYLTPAGFAEAARLKTKLSEAGITRQELDAEYDSLTKHSGETTSMPEVRRTDVEQANGVAESRTAARRESSIASQQQSDAEGASSEPAAIESQRHRSKNDDESTPRDRPLREWGDRVVPRRAGYIDWSIPGTRLGVYMIFKHLPDDHDLRLNVFNKLFKEELTLCGRPKGTEYQKLRAQVSELKMANKKSHWKGALTDAKGVKGEEMLQRVKAVAAEVEAARQ